MQEFYDSIERDRGLSADEVNRFLDRLVTHLHAIPADMKYQYLGPEVEAFYGETGLKDCIPFHRLLMSRLLETFRMDRLFLKAPASLTCLYEAEFDRIRRTLREEAFSCGWDNDIFVKDVAITTGRLIPAGPGLLQVSGVPRRLLVRKGPGQFFGLVSMLLFGLKGREPLLTVHMHMANVKQFTPEGWEEFYRITSEILELNPDMKGLMRHAWFFDPEITGISPKLAYLREIPEKNGAKIYYFCDQGADSGALIRSATRRTLFETGKYTPRVYYLLWPRDRLIAYARMFRSTGNGD
ncbi:hypothetical protein [Emcibacter sp.]|uniref:hypothetical protein n=1 Tax=Emcibacter sp. TaxID=1979954 RepID=UPI003A905A30